VDSLSLTATGSVMSLAFVLALAAAAKLRRPSSDRRVAGPLLARAAAFGELSIGVLALVLPVRAGASLLAVLFGWFAVVHVRSHGREADCECFGENRASVHPHTRHAVLTAGSALLAAALAAASPLSPISALARHPAPTLAVAAAAILAALAWRAAFTGHVQRAAAGLGDRLVTTSAEFLERRVSRRTLLRVAFTGSALAVAPLRYLLYPVSALAAIHPSDCAEGLCTDGYTAFCCEVNSGVNTCPPGTFAGGWWMCTSYRGSKLCAEQGVRYYVDCNRDPGHRWPCACANGSCAHRREACNRFRYGQCNTHIREVTEVVCRMILCENPGAIPELNCSSSVAVDNAVCEHEAPCLGSPQATQLVGAGGV
jgi:hypothetical protein